MPQNVNEDSNIDTKMSESNYENDDFFKSSKTLKFLENPKRFKGYYSKISLSTSNELSSTLQSTDFTSGEFNTPSRFSRCDMKSLCLIVEESLAFALHSDSIQHDKHTLIIKAEKKNPVRFRFEKNYEAPSFKNCLIFVESRENSKTDHWDLVHCDKQTCLFNNDVYFVRSRLPSIYDWEDLYKKEGLTLNARCHV
ncbi:hypothetical protein HMI56_004726, partial [Coelomomyces lativittatus]